MDFFPGVKMYQECMQWIQGKRCECLRRGQELDAKRMEAISMIPGINTKTAELNCCLLRVKESLASANEALIRLSQVSGVRYKLDQMDRIESEIGRQLRNLNDTKESLKKTVLL